jgi:hypothetical protein
MARKVGWSHDKRVKVEKAFYEFLNRCYINSKDEGRVCLGEKLYDGQIKTITEIFDALEEDIHDIYILKSRQLGISTLIRALIVFLSGIIPGLKGAIVFDTDQNKIEARSELEIMIHDLPPSLRFSRVRTNNRTSMTLSNDSKVLFMAAGVRKTKNSGVLGRAVGLSLAHCSELCSWDNDEGLEAFRNSLSDSNPDRLYIYESTARGFNTWSDMWKEARADSDHCRCIFLGWYTKPSQRIAKDHPDFAKYGMQIPTEKEKEKVKEVFELYNYRVTMNQLAWYRRKIDPSAVKDDEGQAEFEASPLRIQEQPWTEEEAFQQTGSVFFHSEHLTKITKTWVRPPMGKYFFWVGQEFFNTQIFESSSPRMIELKIWEEPEKDASYVIGIDPAYGENELNDRSSIQVLKCYADGIDQVAEYASPLVTTYQLAWVIAALLGWYGRDSNEVRYVMEINGPGTAVFNELRSLKAKIEGRMDYREWEERGLRDLFRNVKTYIWTRADSMGVGYNYHLRVTALVKVPMMERMRDFVSNGLLRIRSANLIDEMKKITRVGDSIAAEGRQKDDRVLAMAFAAHCWEEKARRALITANRTRGAEVARKSARVADQVALFQKNQLQSFFNKQAFTRTMTERQLRYQAWRHAGRRF